MSFSVGQGWRGGLYGRTMYLILRLVRRLHNEIFLSVPYFTKDINQDISVGDIGLVEVPKEDRQKHGQRNLLVQVMDLENNQLVLAPLIDSGLGPNLRIRYSMEAFLKGRTFPISCLSRILVQESYKAYWKSIPGHHNTCGW